jgi:serine-threonine kinase receptor-associated protein
MRWWDRRTLHVTRKISFDNPITSMELSSNTQRLVVTSGKMVAFIPAQPAETGTPAHSLNLPYAPSSASVHPIWQDRFVTGSTSDEWVRIHKINGEESELLKGHHGPVHCVEYSPDGEVYASGSGGYKRIHLVVHVRLTISVLYLSSRLWSIRGWYVNFSVIGPFVLTLVHSGTIRLWQTTPGKLYGLWQGTASNGGG